jgi:transposase-like protein
LPDRYPAALRLDAVRLYLSGLSFRAVGRRMNVNHQSIINWVNTYAQAANAEAYDRLEDISF